MRYQQPLLCSEPFEDLCIFLTFSKVPCSQRHFYTWQWVFLLLSSASSVIWSPRHQLIEQELLNAQLLYCVISNVGLIIVGLHSRSRVSSCREFNFFILKFVRIKFSECTLFISIGWHCYVRTGEAKGASNSCDTMCTIRITRFVVVIKESAVWLPVGGCTVDSMQLDTAKKCRNALCTPQMYIGVSRYICGPPNIKHTTLIEMLFKKIESYSYIPLHRECHKWVVNWKRNAPAGREIISVLCLASVKLDMRAL